MVKETKVQEAFIEAKGQPIIVECATKVQCDDPAVQVLSLQILWTLAFHSRAAEELRMNTVLKDYLTSLLAKDVQEMNAVMNAAGGLYWKLEQEPKHLANMNASNSDHMNYQYDVMMSYNNKDSELVRKIHEKLIQENFKVWMRKESMHSCAMEHMAEGIEQSKFVIMCVSSSYMKSLSCKSEASYAQSLKKEIVLLKIQTDLIYDSWLITLTKDSSDIDFEKKTFEEAYKELSTKIESSRNSNEEKVDSDLVVSNGVPASKPSENTDSLASNVPLNDKPNLPDTTVDYNSVKDPSIKRFSTSSTQMKSTADNLNSNSACCTVL